MSELIPHEIQIGLSAECLRDQSDHLVQCNSPADGRRGPFLLGHVGVYLLVEEPHGQGLVPHDALVVALHVGDALLVPAAIGEGEHDAAYAPVLVLHLLQQLDPLVGHRHVQAIVKAKAPLVDGPAQRRHAGNVLGHRDRLRVEFVDQVVRQHQVHVRVHVQETRVEVLVVLPREDVLDSVVLVQHGGDPIESEAVEVELLEVPPEVGEQEADNLPV